MKKNVLNRIIILTLLTAAIVPMIAFFYPGLPHGHDAQDHVVRIANFYKALTEGILIPRWGANLNWGYGHPVLMFLYPFSSYLASLFHFAGLSYVDATKAVFVVAYIAGILSMYLWVSSAWGKRAGVIGALFYGFAPYRFADIYVRMAIGEHMAFVFPPLICYFLYKLAKNNIFSKNQERRTGNFHGIGLSITFAALILSHNALALMFLPLIGFYMLYLYFFETKRRLSFIAHCLLSIGLGFGLSSFFWVPALFEGKYTLRNIITAGEALNRFVPFRWFFYSPWNYGGGETITKEVGIAQWIGIAASIAVFFRTKKQKEKILLVGLWGLFILSLFIMTSASWWIWKKMMILQNFQFPLRFLSVTVFIVSCIGGISIAQFLANMKNQSLKNVLFIVFCILPIVFTMHMWHPKDYQIKDESFYTGIYSGTTDTGESSPIWTTRFMEHTAPNPMEVISGEAVIKSGRRTTTVHEYRVSAKTRAELLENTLFFPGWKITVDGIGAGIQYQDANHRGLMTFWIDEGEHDVKVEFQDTKLRKTANYISTGSIIGIILIGIGAVLWKKRK